MFFQKSLVFIGIIYLHACVGAPAQDGCPHNCTSEKICKAIHFSGSCYYVFTDSKMTWDKSGELCTSRGMTMVQSSTDIMKKGLQSPLQDIFEYFEAGSYVWLGGKVNDLNDWIFVNRVRLNETRAKAPSAFEEGKQLHVCGVFKNTNIDKDDCRYMKPFICRFENMEVTQGIYISETAATWYDARSQCVRRGGDLFYLKTEESVDYWKTKLPAKQEFFIGLTRRLWLWKNGSEIFHFNWQDKEPNKLSEKCLVMYPSTGQWNDMSCDSKMYPFCYGGPDADSLENLIGFSTESVLSQSGCCEKNGYIAGIVILTIIALLALLVVAFLLLIRNESCAEKPLFSSITGRLNKVSRGNPSKHDKSPHQDIGDIQDDRAPELEKFLGITQTQPKEDRVTKHFLIEEDPTCVDTGSEWPFAVKLDNDKSELRMIIKKDKGKKNSPKHTSSIRCKDFKTNGREIVMTVIEESTEKQHTYKTHIPVEISPDSAKVENLSDSIILHLRRVDKSHVADKKQGTPNVTSKTGEYYTEITKDTSGKTWVTYRDGGKPRKKSHEKT